MIGIPVKVLVATEKICQSTMVLCVLRARNSANLLGTGTTITSATLLIMRLLMQNIE